MPAPPRVLIPASLSCWAPTLPSSFGGRLSHAPQRARPPFLSQLALSINRKLAAKCGFFRDVSNACLVGIIHAMSPAIFVPAQPIAFEGQALTTVYFINRGVVRLTHRMRAVGTLRDNDSMGFEDYTDAVNDGVPPVVGRTARAVGYCDVMTLSVETLHEAVKGDDVFSERQALASERSKLGSGGGRTQRIRSLCTGLAKRSKTTKVPTNLSQPNSSSSEEAGARKSPVPVSNSDSRDESPSSRRPGAGTSPKNVAGVSISVPPPEDLLNA